MPTLSKAVEAFDRLPDSALVTLADASDILRRSRVSLYRDFKTGRLSLVKVGSSSRIRVGDIRKILAEDAS